MLGLALVNWLHPGGGVGFAHPGGWVRQFRCGLAILADRLQLAGERQDFWQFDHLNRLWRIGRQNGGRGIVIGNFRGLLRCRATGKRRGIKQQKRQAGFTERRKCVATRRRMSGGEMRRPDHDPSSFDQLMALM